MKRLLLASLLAFVLAGCSSANLEDVKAIADKRWESMGFEVVGYDGYNWGFGLGNYGGAYVWYVLKKKGDVNNITYGGCLQRWGDEYHMYNLKAYDAIKPQM